MEQSPSWEANNHSSSQEIPHILWNPCSKEPATGHYAVSLAIDWQSYLTVAVITITTGPSFTNTAYQQLISRYEPLVTSTSCEVDAVLPSLRPVQP
jgi:hypothetical protein